MKIGHILYLLLLSVASQNAFANPNKTTSSCTLKDSIALTFDDGPQYPITNRILDILAENKIKATFFVCGIQLEKSEGVALLKKAYKEGHVIGSHSYSHPDFRLITNDQIVEQMNKTSDAIYKAIKIRPRLMRPPYGAVDDRVRYVLKQLNYRIIGWDVDSDDWNHWNPSASIVAKLKLQMQSKKSALILMHDVYSGTANSLQRVIDYLKENKKKFHTVDECMKIKQTYQKKNFVQPTKVPAVSRYPSFDENRDQAESIISGSSVPLADTRKISGLFGTVLYVAIMLYIFVPWPLALF